MYFITLGKAAMEAGENPPIGVAAGVGSLAGRLRTHRKSSETFRVSVANSFIHSFIHSRLPSLVRLVVAKQDHKRYYPQLSPPAPICPNMMGKVLVS